MPEGVVDSFERAARNLSGGTAGAARERTSFMLRWAVIFFVIAIIAAIFGFGGIAGAATDIAKILFFVFLVIFLLSLVFGLLKGKAPPAV